MLMLLVIVKLYILFGAVETGYFILLQNRSSRFPV